MPLAAVNMINSGEKYGYASYLCTRALYPAGVKFVYQDIACKYTGWQASASSKSSNRVPHSDAHLLEQRLLRERHNAQHVLAEAHGRLHSVFCWVSRAASLL